MRGLELVQLELVQYVPIGDGRLSREGYELRLGQRLPSPICVAACVRLVVCRDVGAGRLRGH